MLLTKNNSKLKKDNIWTFSLPAMLTCPNAGSCKRTCYASQRHYLNARCKGIRLLNFELSRTALFEWLITKEIRDNRIKRVRIHDSGDFYDRRYFEKWVSIAESCPNTFFYAYTKMVSLVKEYLPVLPKNLRIIFSYGGLEDNLINPRKDIHAKVFETERVLKENGYIDASKDDKIAWDNQRIGLVYHGVKKLTNKDWR